MVNKIYIYMEKKGMIKGELERGIMLGLRETRRRNGR